MHGTCWACMQCKLTHKQKHTNYKKLTSLDCTIEIAPLCTNCQLMWSHKVAKDRCSPFVGHYKHTSNFFKVKIACFFPMYIQKQGIV